MNLWTPKRCNCLVWALVMRWNCGGYIARRRTDWASWIAWWDHFLWSPDLETWHAYVPFAHSKRLWPDPWFRGYVEQNDEAYRARKSRHR